MRKEISLACQLFNKGFFMMVLEQDRDEPRDDVVRGPAIGVEEDDRLHGDAARPALRASYVAAGASALVAALAVVAAFIAVLMG